MFAWRGCESNSMAMINAQDALLKLCFLLEDGPESG
jgi:hypothetical protein